MKRSGVFHQLFYHFVWATRGREPSLTPEVEARLYPYLALKCKDLGYTLHAVNGTVDHIHILLALPPAVTVAEVAKNLKGASSHYINRELGPNATLYWQGGYGVVTLRKSEAANVAAYIQNQKEHHNIGRLVEPLERVDE